MRQPSKLIAEMLFLRLYYLMHFLGSLRNRDLSHLNSVLVENTYMVPAKTNRKNPLRKIRKSTKS